MFSVFKQNRDQTKVTWNKSKEERTKKEKEKYQPNLTGLEESNTSFW